MRITSVTPMKDEGPYILEWVAYHRMIGINDIHVFTNHCSDGTDQILERLDEMGLVRHLPNPSVYTNETKHHWSVLNYINTFPRLRRSDWLASFDADEFICVNAGAGHLTDLFEAVGDAQVISMNQLNFGCSGHRKFEDRLQIDRFTHSQDYTGRYRRDHFRRGVKSLTHRSAPFTRFGNHSPRIDKDRWAETRWVNSAGERIDVAANIKKNAIKSLELPVAGYHHVQLNHYALRSIEEFIRQRDRGNAIFTDYTANLKYFRMYDVNEIEQRRIQRHLPAVQDAVEELKRDPELGQLHAASVAHHHERIGELRKQDVYHDLFMRAFRASKKAWPERYEKAQDAA